MDDRGDRRWRPDDAMRASAARDATWTVPHEEKEAHVSPLRRFWDRLSPLSQGVLAVLVSLLLIATGAGLTLVITSAASSPSSAGLYAVNSPGGAIPAKTTRRIAARIDPAVVDVNTLIETTGGPAKVAGTGMVVSSDGLVATNNHVVEGSTSIEVTVGRARFPASFVGAEPAEDIALIRIDADRTFATVATGRSASLQVGEGVLAFGNSLGLGGVPSVTSGIVSALGRAITATSDTGADAEHLSGMIETDVPIAPGNSGGPLVNAAGRVVGMNTAAASPANENDAPVAFALPIRRVAAAVREIERGVRRRGLVIGRTAYLGIEGTSVRLVTSRRGAVSVIQVEPNTPAEMAGLEPGDLIETFDGRATPTMRRLAALIADQKPGEKARIVFQAGGAVRSVTVRLVPGPAA